LLKAKKGKGNGSRRILIIVQNLPVPFDRRVWLECRTLTRAGYQVSVVCPKGPGDPSYQVIDGVQIYKYRPYSPGGGAITFFAEYAYSFLATLLMSLKAARGGRFGAVQSCNPPDIFWPIGLLFKLWHGARFVFDHHDLCPETFESRFPDGSPALYRGLRFLERCTMRTADHVISTNESYRRLVIDRDGVKPARSTVVRTGPDPDKLKAVEAVPSLRRGRPYLAAYIGVMGPQDGVDIVLKMAHFVVNTLKRTDISFTLIGSGDSFGELVALRDQLELGDFVEFTGRAPDEQVRDIMSTADIGLSPDPKNPLNDVSTMNKTMEYMAFELPVLAFDLRETRASAEEASAYATPNDVEEMGRLLVELLDDEPRRKTMGSAGRRRIEDKLAWNHQEPHYLAVYDNLLGRTPAPQPAGPRHAG
jgi:glycosyltransferase involved in cell wall biosynthesis